MNTVFSHIIQKSFSNQYENIATDALAFILNSSESAKHGLMKLLRGINSDLPGNLQFCTQQTEGEARPDMRGDDGMVTRVFIENKFWAGLTENQPVTYLKRLAEHPQSSVLLMVVPAARESTVWRELMRSLAESNISISNRENSVGVFRSLGTNLGPALALTSWARLLSAIEAELEEEPDTKNDLKQLRSLCDSADSHAFQPMSRIEVTDQRTPALLLQLSEIVQEAVDLAVSDTSNKKGFLSTNTSKEENSKKGRLTQTHTWSSIGRYVCFPEAQSVGAWIGTDFQLWKEHGLTPLWLIFNEWEFGRAPEVRSLLDPWATRNNVFAINHYLGSKDGNVYAVAIELPTGEEKDQVVRSVVNQLRNIAEPLAKLPPIQKTK